MGKKLTAYVLKPSTKWIKKLKVGSTVICKIKHNYNDGHYHDDWRVDYREATVERVTKTRIKLKNLYFTFSIATGEFKGNQREGDDAAELIQLTPKNQKMLKEFLKRKEAVESCRDTLKYLDESLQKSDYRKILTYRDDKKVLKEIEDAAWHLHKLLMAHRITD